MVAMVSRRRSRWLFTALPTPTPPTSSAVRPTMVRNCVKRSTLRSSCGEALLRLRMSQPASGNCARACAVTALAAASLVSLCRQAQPIVPAHQTAGLQQAGGAQRRLAHQQARSEADAAGELVRLARQRGADLECGVADGQPRARLDVEPRQQRRIGRGAERAVALRQRVARAARRIEHGVAEKRIGAVDRFHFDQRGFAVGFARHRAHGRGARNCAVLVQERPLVR